MEVLGKILKIYDKVDRSETFSLREFVLHVPNPRDSRYDNYIRFQLNNERTSLIDEYKEGEEVLVSFDLSGREWTSPEGDVRYISSLVAWKLQRAGSGSNVNTAQAYDIKQVYGRLHKKLDVRQITPTFSVHEFVMALQSPNSQYEDYVLFQLVGRNTGLIDQYNVGDMIHVVFDLQGRKYVGKDSVERYYNSYNAFRIDREQPQAQQPAAQPIPQQAPQPAPQPATAAEQQIVGAAAQPSAPQQPADNAFLSSEDSASTDDLPF